MATTAKTTKPAAKKATSKKAAVSAEDFEGITAYCVKTKERNVPMLDAKIDITGGRYIAKGVDADGNKMTAILNGEKAKQFIKDKHAAKGEGWGK